MRQSTHQTRSNAPALPELWVCPLGTVPYVEGVEIQEHVAARRRDGEAGDTLLLLEHPPVYTRGRRAKDEELALGEDFYRSRGIEIVPTDRGGRVTYHGPGQLVGYPIMGVADVLAHLRTIEAAIVQALARVGIDARSRCQEGPDWTGVWVGERKIASLGVHVSRGVSTHGFAINVVNDLAPFSWIVPCGLSGVSMTSVAQEIGEAADFARLREHVVESFCRLHGRQPRPIDPSDLGIGAADQGIGTANQGIGAADAGAGAGTVERSAVAA